MNILPVRVYVKRVVECFVADDFVDSLIMDVYFAFDVAIHEYQMRVD